jgi:hypothetical protein
VNATPLAVDRVAIVFNVFDQLRRLAPATAITRDHD